MPLGATRINLEIKNVIGSYLYMKSKKKKKMREMNYLQNRNRLTDIENKFMVSNWESRVMGRDKLRI